MHFAIAVRRMRSSDSGVLDEIARLSDSDVNFATEHARPWARVWVAEERAAGAVLREPVAFLLAWAVADELQLINIATHPQQRRRGAGHALVSALVTCAQTERFRLVLLEVRRSNQIAIQLYREHGFQVTGVRRKYYSDGEDAFEMRLTLDPESGTIIPLSHELPVTDA